MHPCFGQSTKSFGSFAMMMFSPFSHSISNSVAKFLVASAPFFEFSCEFSLVHSVSSAFFTSFTFSTFSVVVFPGSSSSSAFSSFSTFWASFVESSHELSSQSSAFSSSFASLAFFVVFSPDFNLESSSHRMLCSLSTMEEFRTLFLCVMISFSKRFFLSKFVVSSSMSSEVSSHFSEVSSEMSHSSVVSSSVSSHSSVVSSVVSSVFSSIFFEDSSPLSDFSHPPLSVEDTELVDSVSTSPDSSNVILSDQVHLLSVEESVSTV